MFEEGFAASHSSPLEEMQATMQNHREYIANHENSEQVKMFKMLKKLQSNREFKKLIGEVYLKNEVVRLANLKAHATMNSPEKQQFLDNQIMAIGCLNQFFLNIEAAHAEAEQRFEDVQQDLHLMEDELLEYERATHADHEEEMEA